MVHEFTHISLKNKVKDEDYGCPEAEAFAKEYILGTALSVQNSDNYRCFVEASAVAEAQEILEELRK